MIKKKSNKKYIVIFVIICLIILSTVAYIEIRNSKGIGFLFKEQEHEAGKEVSSKFNTSSGTIEFMP